MNRSKNLIVYRQTNAMQTDLQTVVSRGRGKMRDTCESLQIIWDRYISDQALSVHHWFSFSDRTSSLFWQWQLFGFH